MKPKPKPAPELPPGLIAEIMMFRFKAESARQTLTTALAEVDRLIEQSKRILEKLK